MHHDARRTAPRPRSTRARGALAAIGVSLLGLACSGSGSEGTTKPPPKTNPPPNPPPPKVPTIPEFMENLHANPSCALLCSASCKEADKPWVCPALADWKTIPHADACGSYDGTTTPKPVDGKCKATLPSGEALLPASRTSPVILPDGRRVKPAGTEWLFDESDLPGGFPAHAILVPGGAWLIVSDDGYDTNALRVIDTATLRAGGTTSPVTAVVKYESPAGLNYGLAYASSGNVVYASGNLATEKILAFDLDTTKGTLTEDPSLEIALPSGTLPQAIDISPDGQTLIVSQALDNHTLVYSLAMATYGKKLAAIELGTDDQDAFALHYDPFDATGQTAYTTLWTTGISPENVAQMPLLQIDLGTSKVTSVAVGKAPEELVFLNSRYAVIANALSDSLSMVDLTAGMAVGEISIPTQGQTHGAGPSALAFDSTNNRVYVTLSSVNGVAAFDVDLSGTPPSLTLLGVIPTSWWPTSVNVDPSDGTLYVTTGKGHGSGTDDMWRDFSDGEVAELIRGSVQAVPLLTPSELSAATATFDAQNIVAGLSGQSTVECGGAAYDFPIPEKVTEGPSPLIKHVFFIVRENKTFDDLFGDLPNVNGDPKLVMSPGNMEAIWGNARSLAKTFAHMDNYYSDAEQSIQGHAWTVFGRTTDYAERRWLDIWGRAEFSILDQPGVGDNTTPVEGDLFSWLTAAGTDFDDMGELVGGLQYRDLSWPGGSSDSTIPDTTGACYLAAYARVYCSSKTFTYAWLANDHTFGYGAGYPNPALMISTNDEATGMLVDGLSHSPLWPSSLVIVIEDDPNTGGDHVDLHRSISLFASPWVKRGYVSHGHYDVASLHKLFAHVLGAGYRNATIANAALPLDMFTSTPDYTPYTYIPRGYHDLSCNPKGTRRALEAAHWDFDEPDNQPGLGQQVWEGLRALPPR
jgi:DNA-binding beta-propeller fold protein YncE